MALGNGWTNLTERLASDWQSNAFAGAGIAAARQAFVARTRDALRGRLALEESLPAYRLQANWPGTLSTWKVPNANLFPGASLSDASFGNTNDSVPNGLAAGLYWDVTSRYVYLLTNNGKLIRADGDNPQTRTIRDLGLINPGVTFTSTAIAMNANCSRLYVLSDSGRLYIIDARDATMTVHGNYQVSNDAAGTGKYLIPFVDPVLSKTNGAEDVVFVPLNNGQVVRYIVGANHAVSTTTYDVATTATPITGCTSCNEYTDATPDYKLAAPPICIGGRILVGDTEGVFHDYDTTASSNQDTTYKLSSTAGIMAPAAAEVQDASAYTNITTPTGGTETPERFKPVYAFVPVARDSGINCAMVNLVSRTVEFSRPLFVDDADGDATRKVRGKAHNYGYSLGSATTLTLEADTSNGDAANVVTTAGDTIATSALAYSADRLAPATRSGGPSDGPVMSFLRFTAATLPPDKAIITEAKLVLTARSTTTTYPPRVYRTGGFSGGTSGGIYQRGTTTTWTSSATAPLSASNYPVPFNQARTTALAPAGDVNATSTFTSGTAYDFDVTPCIGGPVKQASFAFALGYDSPNGGHQVIYPTSATAPNNSTTWPAPEFHTQASDSTKRPKLVLTYRTLSNVVPDAPPLLQPVIDATRKRVYVAGNNYVFALDFTSPATWSDTIRSANLNSAGTTYTSYQAAYWGRASGARASSTYYRMNMNMGVAFDLSRLYVFSRANRGGASNGELALSRVTPNLTSGADALGDTDRAIDDTDASKTVSTHIFNALTQTDNPIPRGLPTASRYPLVSPYANLLTRGGDIYFSTLSNTGVASTNILRIGADN
jgi:hypothetical protein